MCLCIGLSVCLSACLSGCLSVYLSARLRVRHISSRRPLYKRTDTLLAILCPPATLLERLIRFLMSVSTSAIIFYVQVSIRERLRPRLIAASKSVRVLCPLVRPRAASLLRLSGFGFARQSISASASFGFVIVSPRVSRHHFAFVYVLCPLTPVIVLTAFCKLLSFQYVSK